MSTKAKVLILAIIAVILIGLVVIIPFVTSPKDKTSLDLESYNKLIKEDNALVFYGSKSEDLTKFFERYDTEISVLNPSSLSKSEVNTLGLKEGYIYAYSKGKEIYNTDFNSMNYKTTKEMIEKKLIKGNYIEVTLNEYKELVKAEGYNIMFVGRETCSWCDKFKESIKTAMNDNNFYVYYIDTDKLQESDYNELYATDEYFTKEEWGTPLSFIYKDGKRIDVINGYVESSELIDTLKKNKVL